MDQANEMQSSDKVLEETRRIKEALAREFDFDIDRILEDARKKQQQRGRKVTVASGRQDRTR